MVNPKANPNRPLSPHLQVYRPQITSFMSIMHRITGVALSVGTLFFSYWLVSATYGPEKFATAQAVLGSWFGQFILWGFTFSIFYHLCNGIRHLIWDAGCGFEMEKVRMSGIAAIVISGVLTALTLVMAYSSAGGA